MVFTMAYSAHPDRKTAFEQQVRVLGLRHFRIALRSPWQNGFIERSNRTDNEECFRVVPFGSSEERLYQHRLFEMYENTIHRHQGLGGQSPVTVFAREYRLEAACVLQPMAYRRRCP